MSNFLQITSAVFFKPRDVEGIEFVIFFSINNNLIIVCILFFKGWVVVTVVIFWVYFWSSFAERGKQDRRGGVDLNSSVLER